MDSLLKVGWLVLYRKCDSHTVTSRNGNSFVATSREELGTVVFIPRSRSTQTIIAHHHYCGVCVLVCVRAYKQPDHSRPHNNGVTLIFFVVVYLSCRVNTMFYCVRDTPASNGLTKWVFLHNYIIRIVSYYRAISTPIQIYIVCIYFTYLLF